MERERNGFKLRFLMCFREIIEKEFIEFIEIKIGLH
jgi:hypothetical protein